MINQRHGVAEVELLRRYGRLPVGHRGKVPFVLTHKSTAEVDGKPVGQYDFSLKINLGGGSRPMQILGWTGWRLGERNHFTISHRGADVPFAGDVYDYVLLSVTHSLERQETRSKHQRFRVVKIGWNDD